MTRPQVGAAPVNPQDAATVSFVNSKIGYVIITYGGSSWPARTTVTVPSGGYALYDSSAYPGALQPTDWTGADVWLQAASITPPLASKQVAWFTPLNNSTSLTGASGIVFTGVGSTTGAVVVSGGTAQTKRRRVENAVTVAAATAVCGFRETNAQYTTNGGFIFTMRAALSRGIAAAASRRFFMGMTSNVVAPTDVAFSTITNDGIGVISESTDTNLFITYRTGAGTAVRVDTGMVKSVADNTEMYDLQMIMVAGGTTIAFTLTRLSDGVVFTHTSTTAIPASGTLLAPRVQASVGGISSVIGVMLCNLYIETVSA